jgi:prephenate dehydratase
MTTAETAAFIAAAERGKAACREACRELRRMVDMINADRAARGVAPLENNITVPGEA